MTARTSLPRRTAALLLAGAALAAATACGDQRDHGHAGGKPRTSAADARLADRLPEDVRSAGVITVGSDIAYPPVEFVDASGEVTGLDVDIARALGNQLGVGVRFENGTFDTLVTGLRANRYDIVMSAMNDTEDRQNGIDSATGKKVGEGVDFVDYFTAGVSLYGRRKDTGDVRGWTDLCGRTVAVQRGTVAHDLAKTERDTCARAGGPPLDLEAYDTDQQAQTRVRSGGADVGCSDFPAAAYAVKTSGGGKDFTLIGEQTGAAPYGIAVAKRDTRLRDALAAALDAIIASGQYGKILADWGGQDGAVTKAVINGGA
ncbi:ABC transporter substrate-binding protein [Streptomyces ficellus]|uniref:AtrA protein n=1 Tax=Streptomyces ficellus TaxID=1977088 RepID=A0A1W5T3X4_9ACTN|nr:ABC transporter substrate-binding protein [Streptomyces ficellus]ARF06203.1 AtrA protein [Streptomyces ficellus]